MRFKERLLISMVICLGLGSSVIADAKTPKITATPTLAQSFAAPPDDARPMVRWWWFGSAVTPDELKREIKAMRKGGFGGFEIQPVYPLSLDDPANGIRNLPYLSDDFLKAVRVASDTGRAQGMRVDITLGSGWPYGGPHIGIDEASAKIAMVKVTVPAGTATVALPALGPGEHFIAALVSNSFAPDDIAGAKPVAAVDGQLSVTAAANDRMAYIFKESRTGQQVKRPSIGGEGNVLDHMNAEAVQHHLSVVGDRLMTAFGDHPPYAVFSDSLEVYGADWTDDFLAEFRKRRGYDLAPHLLDLFYDTPTSADIRHDWGLTLSELADTRYLTPIDTWAKAHGTRFRSQTYGFPPVTLSSNRLVALPEGEQPNWRKFTTTRWASSANHLYGQPVTSAESWTWLHGAAFRATPLDIKAEADTLMLEGVNQFIAHGWPYTPPGVAEPGWALYAAAVFNDHNPWWAVMPDINAYLQRMSFLLRQGQPVADVAIFLPTDDAWAATKPGQATVSGQMNAYATEGLTTQILDAGYSFDYVDSQSIMALGVGHKVLILPHVRRIDPEAYKKINDFAKAGGIVIAVDGLPDTGTGLVDADTDAQAVRFMSGALFGPGVGPGRESSEAELGATLKVLTAPDLDGAPPEIGFVHRHLKDGDLYFVANTGNHPISAPLHFRTQTTRAQWWEPRTGQAHGWKPGTKVTLAPYESRVFVFGAAASAPVVREARASKVRTRDLAGGWCLTFKTGRKCGALPGSWPGSWSDDPTTQFYSGTVSYTRTLTFTKSQIRSGQVVLNFGEGQPLPAQPERQLGTSALLSAPVRDAAEVFVNGKRVGSVWTAPFSISLKGFVHPGDNRLEIRVSNTAINLLAGRPPTDYSQLTAKFGERFTPQGMKGLKPLPSGLLQPVTLETGR